MPTTDLLRVSASLDVVLVKVFGVAAGQLEASFEQEPVSVLSQAARNPLVLNYVLCKAKARGELQAQEDVDYFVQFVALFLADPPPTADQVLAWQKEHPPPFRTPWLRIDGATALGAATRRSATFAAAFSATEYLHRFLLVNGGPRPLTLRIDGPAIPFMASGLPVGEFELLSGETRSFEVTVALGADAEDRMFVSGGGQSVELRLRSQRSLERGLSEQELSARSEYERLVSRKRLSSDELQSAAVEASRKYSPADSAIMQTILAGHLLTRFGDEGNALLAYLKALEICQTSQERRFVLYLVGEANLGRRNYPAAATSFRRVIVHDPSEEGVRDLDASVGAAADVELSDLGVVYFELGRAELSADALSELGRIAALIRRLPRERLIVVSGHADDIPCCTNESGTGFESNWELSAGRATRVARHLIDLGVAPSRVVVLGSGEVRPALDNTSASGRARNRRAEVRLFP